MGSGVALKVVPFPNPNSIQPQQKSAPPRDTAHTVWSPAESDSNESLDAIGVGVGMGVTPPLPLPNAAPPSPQHITAPLVVIPHVKR